MTMLARQVEAAPTASGSLATGPILRTMLAFSASTLVSNLLQTVIQSIGMIWIGRLLGEEALAATANGNQVMSLLSTVMLGLAMATMIRIGRHAGAGDASEARGAFACGLGLTIALGLALGLGGFLLTDRILHLLGTPPESLAEARAYLRVMFLTLPAVGLTNTLAMASRGSGNARIPLYGTVVTLLASATLTPVLILGFAGLPRLGVAGAALASGLSNLLGVLLMAALLWRRSSPLRLGRAELPRLAPWDRESPWLLRNGVPISVHMNLVVLAQLVMIGLVNREGLNYTAAFGVSLQIWLYLQMPSFAISAGITAMAAQAIGAGDHVRVGQIKRTGVRVSLTIVGLMIAVILLLIRPILALFLGAGSPALPIGVHMQVICIWAFIFTTAMSAMTAVLRAYGAQLVTVVVNLVALFGMRLACYFAAYPLIGADALWWSFVVGSAASLALTHLAYQRGGWGREAEPGLRRRLAEGDHAPS